MENLPPSGRYQGLSFRRIREQVTSFVQSDYFQKMRRLKYVLMTNEELQKDKSQPLSMILGRYPFLFQDCILPQENYRQAKEALKHLRVKERQRDFKISLLNYVNNQVQISRLAKHYGSLSRAQKLIPPLANPTLLKDAELVISLQHFLSGIKGESTYEALSSKFITHGGKVATFQTYKQNLYQYLISSLDENYAQKQFNRRLESFLKNTLVDWDEKKPSQQLIIRLASKLLSFLIVESSENISHYLYLDLVTNLGPTKTIGILLKIMLISEEIYPYITHRFAILFSHYENTPRKDVHWLFKSLENLNIALTIYKNSVDLSDFQRLM